MVHLGALVLQRLSTARRVAAPEPPRPEEQLAETIRREGTRVLATLIRTLGRLQLAEDAVQDAAVVALQTWPRDGIPDDPRAWLTVTARHKAYDTLRREAVRPGKELASVEGVALVVPDPVPEVLELVEPDSVVRDDQLRLVFTCCHPALAREAQVALALRARSCKASPGSGCSG